MFLHKRSSILGILGVFVLVLLILAFNSSKIRNQARILSSFGQASPPAPFPGHEEYPPTGYGKVSITLNFKTPYYHKDFHTYIRLEQSVKTNDGFSRSAAITRLISLKRGVNTIEFDNVPARLTELHLDNGLYDKDKNLIDSINVEATFDTNCIVSKQNTLSCAMDIKENTTHETTADFEVVSQMTPKDNLHAVAFTSLVQPNNDLNIKMFVCNVDNDPNCRAPETHIVKAQENIVPDAERLIKQLTPGWKKVYFDTNFFYDENLNKTRPIEKSHLGFYIDPNTNKKTDWHKSTKYFISAFDEVRRLFIELQLVEQQTLNNKIKVDKFNLNFDGRPTQGGYAKLVPCSFIADTDRFECFEESALLKEIGTKENIIETINVDNKYAGWKIEENLYNAQGRMVDEKWHKIDLSDNCIPRDNAPANLCLFNALEVNSYGIYLTLKNNFVSNKNLVGHTATVVTYDSVLMTELSEKYANTYVRVKACSSPTNCDNVYSGLTKIMRGTFDTGRTLEFPGIDFVPNQTIQLDGYIYDKAGKVVSAFPKDWIITTTCHDAHNNIDPSGERTCKYAQLGSRYSYSTFIISLKEKEKVTIETSLKVLKKNTEKVTILGREICATQSGYLCRTLQTGDYALNTSSQTGFEFNEKLVLSQHDEFADVQIKTPLVSDTKYFIKYSVSQKNQRYEKIFPIEYGAKNELVLNTSRETPIVKLDKVKRKVKVLVHNYYLPKEKRKLFDIIGQSTDTAKSLVGRVVDALNVPNNPITFEIANVTELQTFPKFTKLNDPSSVESMFVKCAKAFGRQEECEEIERVLGIVDYVELERDLNLCESVNKGEFDEVWNVNMPYTPVGEDDIFGPYPINLNGIVTKITKCNKNVPVLSVDVLSPLYQAMHSFGHRVESLRFVFDDNGNDWNDLKSPPENIFEEFVLSDYTENKDGKSHVYSGCGSVHFPPNITQDSEDGYRQTQSICDNFSTFAPSRVPLVRKSKLIDCTEWGCSGEGYYTWWLMHLPTGEGKDEKGRFNNWWQYIIYTENLVKDSAIAKLMVLDQNKNGIFDKSDYDTFVAGTKRVPLKNQNTILDQNSDQKLTTTDASFYKNKIGTVLPNVIHKHDKIFKFAR